VKSRMVFDLNPGSGRYWSFLREITKLPRHCFCPTVARISVKSRRRKRRLLHLLADLGNAHIWLF